MTALIKQHGFEVLTRYPRDVLVHDRNFLMTSAHPGATLAWMVGHSHTHIVALGMHPNDNKLVSYLTNLSMEDRFYVIKIASGSFEIKEMRRDEFPALARTSVPYSRKGQPNSFWLYKGEQRVGYCSASQIGAHADAFYSIQITPDGQATPIDRTALDVWANHAVTEISGTLFAKRTISWNAACSGSIQMAA